MVRLHSSVNSIYNSHFGMNLLACSSLVLCIVSSHAHVICNCLGSIHTLSLNCTIQYYLDNFQSDDLQHKGHGYVWCQMCYDRMCWGAGVDGARTEKARSGMLIVVCQALVELGVVHTSSPAFPFPCFVKKDSDT